MAAAALEEMPPAFAGVAAFSLGSTTSVTSPMLLHAAKPTEMCLIVALRLEFGEAGTHDASICIPLTVLIPILDALERIDQAQGHGDSATALEDIRERLLEAPVEVRVSFPEVMLCHDELATLEPGDVIGLHRGVDSPMLLSVGGSPFCQVVAASRGKRVACMVVDSEQEIRR